MYLETSGVYCSHCRSRIGKRRAYLRGLRDRMFALDSCTTVNLLSWISTKKNTNCSMHSTGESSMAADLIGGQHFYPIRYFTPRPQHQSRAWCWASFPYISYATSQQHIQHLYLFLVELISLAPPTSSNTDSPSRRKRAVIFQHHRS